jgi:hypothetical protein
MPSATTSPLCAAPAVRIVNQTIGTLRIEEVGPEQAAPILREYLQQVPIARPYFDVTLDSPLEKFAGEAPRHPVFRLVGPRHGSAT